MPGDEKDHQGDPLDDLIDLIEIVNKKKGRDYVEEDDGHKKRRNCGCDECTLTPREKLKRRLLQRLIRELGLDRIAVQGPPGAPGAPGRNGTPGTDGVDGGSAVIPYSSGPVPLGLSSALALGSPTAVEEFVAFGHSTASLDPLLTLLPGLPVLDTASSVVQNAFAWRAPRAGTLRNLTFHARILATIDADVPGSVISWTATATLLQSRGTAPFTPVLTVVATSGNFNGMLNLVIDAHLASPTTSPSVAVLPGDRYLLRLRLAHTQATGLITLSGAVGSFSGGIEFAN